MKRWIVTLDDAERAHLTDLVTTGTRAARTVLAAQVLLKAADDWTDTAIAAALPVSVRTIERVRRRCVEEGVEAALKRRPYVRHTAPLLDGEAEAQLVTIACSPPPDGRARWTLRLLAGRMVELAIVPHVCPETVRRTLKKTPSSRGRNGSGASSTVPTRPMSRPWKTSSTSTSARTIRRAR